ncbi:MAG: hypothetical protein AAF805_05755, partial [Planctomycetota bacterium]
NWFDQLGDTPGAESSRPLVEYHKALLDDRDGDLESAIDRLERIEGPPSAGARLRAARLRESVTTAADAEPATAS